MADKMDMDDPVNVDLEPEDALRILLGQDDDPRSTDDREDDDSPEAAPA